MILECWISPLISFSENWSALTVFFPRLSCFSPSPIGSFLYCWCTRRDIFCKAGNSLDNVTTRTERRCCSAVNISHDLLVLGSFPELLRKFKRQSRHSVLSRSLCAVRGVCPASGCFFKTTLHHFFPYPSWNSPSPPFSLSSPPFFIDRTWPSVRKKVVLVTSYQEVFW